MHLNLTERPRSSSRPSDSTSVPPPHGRLLPAPALATVSSVRASTASAVLPSMLLPQSSAGREVLRRVYFLGGPCPKGPGCPRAPLLAEDDPSTTSVPNPPDAARLPPPQSFRVSTARTSSDLPPPLRPSAASSATSFCPRARASQAYSPPPPSVSRHVLLRLYTPRVPGRARFPRIT